MLSNYTFDALQHGQSIKSVEIERHTSIRESLLKKRFVVFGFIERGGRGEGKMQGKVHIIYMSGEGITFSLKKMSLTTLCT